MEMNSAVPFVGMVAAQVAQVLLIIAGKEALSSGMTTFTFVFYSNALASLILLPISFLTHRSDRPPLTFPLLCGFFLLGVIGCFVQLSGYAGISYTNAAFASAMLNLIPAFTFILAIIFRLEKLTRGSSSTMAKVTGTILSITGAFIVTLYKGPPILRPVHSTTIPQQLLMQPSKWIIGALLLTFDSVLSSAYTIVQALILQKYPAKLIIVFFYCFFVAIIIGPVALIMERDNASAWSLQPKIRWMSVVYSGVFGSAFQVSVVIWCLHQTGPLFVAMFHPLGIVISAALGVIFLGDTFYLGSLIGSIVIVVGFYSVMWGKAKEGDLVGENGVGSLATSEQAPLLQKNLEETGA